MDRTAEDFQKIIQEYEKFFSTPNPDDANFNDENTAFNYIKNLDREKAYEILRYVDILGIDRNFLKRITVDYKIPFLSPNVGGYYSLDKHFIGLNPVILQFGSVNTIVHLILHEAIHAGVVEDLEGVRVKDEALVEFITTQKIKRIFGRVDFVSGYTEIVSQLENLLGVNDIGTEFDIESVIAQINDNNVVMLDKFLEIIVLNPLIKSRNPQYLSFFEIEDELRKKWQSILDLFPRLVNDLHSPQSDPHQEALMRVNEYKFQNLLDIAAERIFANKSLFAKILRHTYSQQGRYIENENDLRYSLRDLGYGYLVDYIDRYNLALPIVITIEQ